MSKPWNLYALHIMDVISKLREIKQRGNILEDDVLYAAALRHLQTMSESTQKLPDYKFTLCPTIQWEDIRERFGFTRKVCWKTARRAWKR